MDLKNLKLPEKKTITPRDFFGKLFQIRDEVHLAHLGTKSYAQHIALGDFYDGILDLTDSIIEQYQGKYGLIDIKIPEAKKPSDACECIKSLAKLTDGGSVYNMFKETWIQNKLDEISSLCYQTLYKLENLK